MRVLALITFVMLGAYSEPSSDNSVASNGLASAASTASPVIQTASGRYRVELDPKVDLTALPQNADLKMVDGEIGQYAIKLCDLEFANKLRPDRCEVFVQPDRSGLLVGYAVLTQGSGVRIDTAVKTDRQKGGFGCGVSGDLESLDFGNPKAKHDIGRDFEGRLTYNAWEKSPGQWLVGPVSDDANEEGAIGVWYVKRLKNKLRITQERWNYCYSDSKIYIDEVFDHAITLMRLGD